ncbi:MAG TPA: hypothetical protein VIY47_02040, partial [Ignavibacteriaceae bacterium]
MARKKIRPDLSVLGPAMVHLLLEVHPLYYRGVMGYDSSKQATSADKIFSLVQKVFEAETPEEKSEIYYKGSEALDQLMENPSTGPMFKLLRPRLWWRDRNSTYTMTEATKIIAEEDAKWHNNHYLPAVKAVLENLFLVGEVDQERNWDVRALEEDWRYVFLTPRPLSTQAKNAFLRSLGDFTPGDVYKFLFRAFREMPQLGENLSEILEDFSDQERMVIN